MKPWSRIINKSVFSAVVVIGFLLSLEWGALLFLDPPPANLFPGLWTGEMEDSRLLWRNRPNSPDLGTEGPVNSHGYRGREFSLERKKGVYRILSLGESTTYGAGVRWDMTYSHLLEERLKKRGFNVEVMNGGVRAWSTVQSVEFLKANVEILKPDMILFYHEINDFLPTTWRGIKLSGAGLTDKQAMEISRRKNGVLKMIRGSRFLSHLRLWVQSYQTKENLKRLADQMGQNVFKMVTFPYNFPEVYAGEKKPWMNNSNPLVRVPDNDRRDTLVELIELTKRHKIKLVFIHPAYLVSKLHECILTQLAKEEGLKLVDFEELLVRRKGGAGKDKEKFFLENSIFHPNESGHALLAEELDKNIFPELMSAARRPDNIRQ